MRKTIFLLLVLVVVIIGLLHFFTPAHLLFYHDTYRRLSYFPIAIGGLLYGLRGGLSLAVLSSIAFIPHLLHYLHFEHQTYISDLTEIILYLAAGSIIGGIASRESRLRDKYKQLSETLARSYDRLYRQTELLLRVEDQLAASQKTAALGEMTAALAHEIKNPLSSIKGTAEILLDEFPKAHPKREFVDILSSEISRLQTAVEEALQFTRTRRSQEEGQDIELASATMERVIRLLKNSPQGKRVDFQIETSPENQTCLVDGDKLFQVFLNVLLNAVDAVPKKQGRVEITIAQEQGDCTIVISDNGPGIGPSEREKIFTPFYTGKQDGTGLGLAISQKIVQSYGGSMTVESSRTGGASFRIHLPQNEAGPDPIQGDYRQSFDLSR